MEDSRSAKQQRKGVPKSFNKMRILVVAILVLCIFLTIITSIGAIRSVGLTFPSILTDPFGVYSAVYLPSWKTNTLKIQRPSEIVSIDSYSIGDTKEYGNFPNQRLFVLSEKLLRSGQISAIVTLLRNGKLRKIKTPFRQMDLVDISLFYGIYSLMGWLVLFSGLIVLYYASQEAGVRAYFIATLGSFLFFISFLDYHTHALLVPVFILGTYLQMFGLFWMTYAFPSRPSRSFHAIKQIAYSLILISIVIIVWLIVEPLFGRETRWLRQLYMDYILTIALLSLCVAMIIRTFLSKGLIRKQILSSLIGFLFIPLALGISSITNLILYDSTLHLLLPLAPLFVALTLGYSIIKYNILNIGVVLNQRVFIPPIFIIAVAISVSLFLILWRVSGDFGVPDISLILLVLLTCGCLVNAGFKIRNHLFFIAPSAFRPSVQQLAENLSQSNKTADINTEIRKLMKHWFPTSEGQILNKNELIMLLAADPKAWDRLNDGSLIKTGIDPANPSILQPIVFKDELLAGLSLSPKKNKALFTNDDLSLLETIASLGAIALNNARLIENVEQLKKLEIDVSQKDKQMSINALGAEIAHEIVYPLNFFRYLLKELKSNHAVEEQDIDIGQEEVERLERMLGGLRKLKHPSPSLTFIGIRICVTRAISLMRDDIDRKQAHISLELPESLEIKADTDLLLQLFSNILRNAIQAIHSNGNIHVQFTQALEGASIDFIDDGDGFSTDNDTNIFAPWVTTKSDGTGLGLVVCQRIVRTFGWAIQTNRIENKTIFSLLIPKTSILIS